MFIIDLYIFIWILYTAQETDATLCKSGYNYPIECPRPSIDTPEQTKCCRIGFEPSCCLERADHVCAISTHKRRGGYDFDPDPNVYAIWCPGPDDPDSYTVCSTNNKEVSCFDSKKFAAIMGGVFGGLALIGLLIGLTFCYLFKSGYCVCVPVSPQHPGQKRYTCMRATTLARLRAEENNMRQINPAIIENYSGRSQKYSTSPPPSYYEEQHHGLHHLPSYYN